MVAIISGVFAAIVFGIFYSIRNDYINIGRERERTEIQERNRKDQRKRDRRATNFEDRAADGVDRMGKCKTKECVKKEFQRTFR